MPKEKKQKRLMTPEAGAPDAVRRGLLTGGALTVAASAAVLSHPAAAGDVVPGDAPKGGAHTPEYVVTDHIAAYYARARG